MNAIHGHDAGKGVFRDDTYRILNPDLRHTTTDTQRHYLRHGKKEGRRVFPAREVIPGTAQRRAGAPQLVVVSPDAGYGAATTALAVAEYFSASHHVIAVFAAGGPQLKKFEDYCIEMWVCPNILEDSYEAEAVAQLISHDVRPSVVFSNTVSSWPILPHLAQRFVPTITLVHEFADYVRPDFVFHNVALWSTRVVFPAAVVMNRAAQLHPRAMVRDCDLAPQAVPTGPGGERALGAADSQASGSPLVVGAGTVAFRKGLDLFVETCRLLKAGEPQRNWRFRWVGPGYDEHDDLGYSVFLAAQIESAGLAGHFEFVGPVDDLDPHLHDADVFLLTSRLDPFPNVAVESLRAGLPVVCFDGASGVAEFLALHDWGDQLLAPAFSCETMADCVLALLDSKDLPGVKATMRALWEKYLALDVYGARLDSLREQAQEQIRQEVEHAASLELSDFVDMRPQHMLSPQNHTRTEAIVHYLRAEATRVDPFRPSPVFSPRIWEEAGQSIKNDNRFLNYLSSGRPLGPWARDVIDISAIGQADQSAMRVIVHIHVHYLDVFERLLDTLVSGQETYELVISATDESLLAPIQSALASHGTSAHSVALAPPTGRNFGSLFDLARSADWDEGVVVCHLHTKKSPQYGEKVGEQWLSFLVQSLGHGGDAAGIRAIASQFSRNDDLGLVFPVDPVLVGVEGNRAHIDRLVANFGLESSPYQEDFPVGGMFWVRGNVIRLLAQRFASLEFDSEPIPPDGSVLHALERVIPRAVLSAGYSSALSFLPGARRE